MVFSSVIFLFAFLPLVLLVYFLLPRAARNVFLLAASLLFYAWGETVYVVIMLTSITMNHIFGILLDRARARGGTRASMKGMVTLAVALNLGMLIVFKYANFICGNLDRILAAAGLPTINLAPVHLPLGISFFTFQAMSYVIDVYRGTVRAQQSWTRTSLFISLFPQLIAGPIVRYKDIAEEILHRRENLKDFASGVRLFVIGLGKKMLIANILGASVDRIYAIPHNELTTPLAWIGAVFFAMQLYFDFAGYSDMAIGMGRMFGFHFNLNFRYPYVARTMTELWQRWHISLSTWFRDYLFTPLGGYRCTRRRAYINLLIVFFLCGLWHGASWNFVIFGMYQGMFLITERIIRANRYRIFKTPAGNLYVIFVVVTTMVWFRTDDLTHAGVFFKAMACFGSPDTLLHPAGWYLDNEIFLAAIAGIIGSTPFLPWLDRKLLGPAPSPARQTVRNILALSGMIAILILCSMKLAAGTHNPFIYFRF